MSVTVQASRSQQIGEALILLLDVADASDEFLETIGAKRVWTFLRDLSEVGESLRTDVAPVMTRRLRITQGTYARYVVVDILVRAHLTSDVRDDRTTMDNRIYLAELIDDFLAADANSDLTIDRPSGKTAEYIEPTDDRIPSDIRDGLGVIWDGGDLREKRQQTVLVRVAYWVDEDY